ncbi:DedA family protein [Streptomyces lydicus]|uniref:DedA family protein n=1 Tax=Streptomyces lydicus TaxID=47763 RepID=UPI0036758B02
MDVLALYGLLVLTTLPPLIPNSALLVTTGVLASRGEVFLPLVLLTVGGSALLGDLLMYAAARRFGEPVRTWMRRNPRRRALLEWTSGRIQRYGLPFVIAVRFLPSGRIVGALASGVLRYPLRKYALGAAIAEVTWATYSVGLGYVGTATTGRPLYAVGVGFGVSCTVAAAGAAIQWAARRRALRDPPEESGEGEGGEAAEGGDGGRSEGRGEGRGGRASATASARLPVGGPTVQA